MLQPKRTPSRMGIDDTQTHRRRILEELCGILGVSENVESLIGGGAMRLENYAVWFVYDERLSPEEMFVYVDLGAPVEPESAYKRLLKLNFQLAAGVRGVMSLHPENDHVLYTFRYPLKARSSGKELLEWLVRFANDMPEPS